MAVKYSVEKVKIGFGTQKTEAYAGRIQLGDTISTEKLEEQVSLRTMLPQSVVHTVLGNIVESVIHFVEEGQGVRLGELGILRPAINTKSASDDDDVQVTKVRVRYVQSKKMRQAAENLSIRKIGDAVADDEEETPSGGTDAGEDGSFE
ncbi:MAG: hypothetical protein IJA95_07450 [Bacteroidaceae bacterium]|nr:hypothetical protein [Bacteroidaceae bacterium]